jgi:hypothetical protein
VTEAPASTTAEIARWRDDGLTAPLHDARVVDVAIRQLPDGSYRFVMRAVLHADEVPSGARSEVEIVCDDCCVTCNLLAAYSNVEGIADIEVVPRSDLLDEWRSIRPAWRHFRIQLNGGSRYDLVAEGISVRSGWT